MTSQSVISTPNGPLFVSVFTTLDTQAILSGSYVKLYGVAEKVSITHGTSQLSFSGAFVRPAVSGSWRLK